MSKNIYQQNYIIDVSVRGRNPGMDKKLHPTAVCKM